MGMQIADFIKLLAQAVASEVAKGPPKSYEVNRTGTDGQQAKQTISLAQVLAEVADQARLLSQQQYAAVSKQQELVESMAALVAELEEQRKLGKKMLRQNRRREEEDEEEEDA
jgi:hypothetical protein